ncbi:hypothetical protein E2C01_036081 [Portunus trituberculatus]|uniref:Uncharacterized protein n=1 Tax=Portunus trituberculatus TaxID=210409 RepID=A0A5B7FB23_PORTR|nr:hypothetical protein [Portunus trituberculatus]
MQKNVVFLEAVAGLRMCTGLWYTSFTSNAVSKRYSGSCEKGDDKALYMTKCVAI